MNGIVRVLLVCLLLVGQSALLAHHHASSSRREWRAAAACRLCDLSGETFGAHASAPRLGAVPYAAGSLADAAAPLFVRFSPLRPSCRAPPCAEAVSAVRRPSGRWFVISEPEARIYEVHGA